MKIAELVREKMASTHKYPCLYCSNDVVAVDMPRVGICKPCYARNKKNVQHLKTWIQFLEESINK